MLTLKQQALVHRSEVKVTQLCPTLCDPIDCTYSPWNSPGQNTGVGSLCLLQGIFPTQGSNPGLPHCRRILYQLSHKGSPWIHRSSTKRLCGEWGVTLVSFFHSFSLDHSCKLKFICNCLPLSEYVPDSSYFLLSYFWYSYWVKSS